MTKPRTILLLVSLLLCLTVGPALAASQRYTIPGDNVFPEGIGGQRRRPAISTSAARRPATSIGARSARRTSNFSCPAVSMGAPMCAD